MRRLKNQIKARCAPFQARHSADAILFLAQIVRERRRLEQERTTLLHRIGKIDSRLCEIGSTETRIAPAIKIASESNTPEKAAVGSAAMERIERPHALPTGVSEFTLQY